MELGQARAAEGGLPNPGQPLGQGNAFQVQKAVEGMIPHGGDSLADGHASDAGAEGVPGGLVPEVLPAQAVFLTAQGNKREVVWNPLKPVYNNDGSLKTYEMDFDHLEKVCDEKCRLLILANPHNPCGIMWDKETLVQLAHFAKTHNLIVVSDEIHCDLAIFGHKHTPFATVSKEAAEVSITFSAPTKTFNIAGVISSWAIVINDDLRRKFYGWLEANELNEPTMFAPVATIAALSQGEPWRREMLAYLEENIRFIEDFCRENIPSIKPVRPQASYLVWLDCRELKLPHRDLERLFTDKAGLALNSGRIFGKQGEGFMRLNAGCPRATLQRALNQLKVAIEG